MSIRAMAKSVLVLIVIGTLVSAQQVSAESVFTPRGIDAVKVVEVNRAAPSLDPPGTPAAGGAGFRAYGVDTVETFDVEIEEEKGPGMWKQLAIFGVITAVVGYAVFELLGSDDEPVEDSGTGGKEPPNVPGGARLPAVVIR